MSITEKEIKNQFKTWAKIEEVLKLNKNKIEEVKSYIDEDTTIIFSGAGTSGYIGDFLVPYLNKGKKKYFYQSIYSTNIVDSPEYYLSGKKVLFVSFARSGNSPESCESINLSNKFSKEVKHIIITCNEEGSLYQTNKESSILLPKETNDKGFAMTNSFSTMLITAAKIFGLEFDLDKLIKESKKIFESFDYDKVMDLDFKNIIYLSNSQNVGLIRELKLKFMELTNGRYGYYEDQFLNFRHGPKSVITKKSIVFILTNQEEIGKKYEDDLIKELLTDENKPYVVCFGKKDKESFLSYEISLNGFSRALSIIPTCQYLAILLSEKEGINPDNPSISGSVNRVVQGVTIYGRK